MGIQDKGNMWDLQNDRFLLLSSETDDALNAVESKGTDDPHPVLCGREDRSKAVDDVQTEEDEKEHIVYIPESIKQA